MAIIRLDEIDQQINNKFERRPDPQTHKSDTFDVIVEDKYIQLYQLAWIKNYTDITSINPDQLSDKFNKYCKAS